MPPFELASDQAMIGVDGLVLPLGQRGFVPGALE
jgi:hypothetical protein